MNLITGIYRYISCEERDKAREEIFKHSYYPCPKRKWQKSREFGEDHRISKIEIPSGIGNRGKVRDQIKQQVIKDGIARSTKIKTDMTGIGKDGKKFPVENLKDWMFGVPGTHGNLQLMGNNAVTFPPQTPKFAVEIVEKALRGVKNPEHEER